MNIKNILVGFALLIVIGIPTWVLGGSFISSLIFGKTPEEAVVIIADQTDLLTGRVDVVENKQETVASTTDVLTKKQVEIDLKQAEVTDSQNALIEAQNALRAKQDDLDAKAAALAQIQANLAIEQSRVDARASSTEARVVQIEQIQAQPTPVPVVVTRTLEVTTPPSDGIDRDIFPSEKRIAVSKFVINATGNTDATISSILVDHIDNGFFKYLWVESDDGLSVGMKTAPVFSTTLPINSTISVGSSKSFTIYADIEPNPPVTGSGRYVVLFIKEITSDSKILNGLPSSWQQGLIVKK